MGGCFSSDNRVSKVGSKARKKYKLETTDSRQTLLELGCTKSTVGAVMQLYRRVDCNKDGHMDVYEFAKLFDNVDKNPFLPRLVQLCDVSGDRQMGLFEFVVCLSQFTNKKSHRGHVYFTWRLFDTKDSGSVTKDEFVKIMSVAYSHGNGAKTTAKDRGVGARAKGLDNILKAMDEDSIEVLSVDDFVKLLKRFSHFLAPAFNMWEKMEAFNGPCCRVFEEIKAAGNVEQLVALASASSERRRQNAKLLGITDSGNGRNGGKSQRDTSDSSSRRNRDKGRVRADDTKNIEGNIEASGNAEKPSKMEKRWNSKAKQAPPGRAGVSFASSLDESSHAMSFSSSKSYENTPTHSATHAQQQMQVQQHIEDVGSRFPNGYMGGGGKEGTSPGDLHRELDEMRTEMTIPGQTPSSGSGKDNYNSGARRSHSWSGGVKLTQDELDLQAFLKDPDNFGDKAAAAATKMQAAARGHRSRTEFREKKDAVIKIQSAHRGRAVRKEMRAQHEAATKVQAIVRGRRRHSAI
mmetsp:Transcript_17037/g.42072  ORF Transcript_17037/g.42072 Transcript_17037/m.42072 type:complete len:520 (-) Transcript_17037:527-2086(-)